MDHVSHALPSDVKVTGILRHYINITKPGIIIGNLISTTGGFLLAAKGSVDGVLLLTTLIGISLVIASGCVLNNSLDRDIDQRMSRTRKRATAQGLISSRAAAHYAAGLGLSGLWLLAQTANWLTAEIALAGLAIYVGPYTVLKRRSLHAALIGSLAGATPPLAGYCAVTGQFDLGALILLAIFSLWQMPHFYAIAVYRLDDYRSASIPVLPVKRGIDATKRHIIGYIVAFIVASVALTLVGYTGYWYLAAAIVAGLAWLYFAYKRYDGQASERVWARKLFTVSIAVVIVMNVMMSIDFVDPMPLSQQQGFASQAVAGPSIAASQRSVD